MEKDEKDFVGYWSRYKDRLNMAFGPCDICGDVMWLNKATCEGKPDIYVCGSHYGTIEWEEKYSVEIVE
jgi:hypothetical protein